MDIFTTQLTRVVPNKLQPSKLKVRALSKDEQINPLLDDEPTQTPAPQGKTPATDAEQLAESKTTAVDIDDDEPPHQLDLYV